MKAFFTFLAVFLAIAGPARPMELRAPTEAVILTVGGAIAVTNYGDTAVFDRPMLEDLGGEVIVTSTVWTNGVSEFEGIKLSTLAELLGVTAGTFVSVALNDYNVEIPVSDATYLEPILAYKRNGSYLTVRDKGPLWVIYPYDGNENARTELIYSRSIWQLDRMIVEE